MGKKSVWENKSVYQPAREEAGLTRAKASEAMGIISESAIEKIEYGQMLPAPDFVLTMSNAYKKPQHAIIAAQMNARSEMCMLHHRVTYSHHLR